MAANQLSRIRVASNLLSERNDHFQFPGLNTRRNRTRRAENITTAFARGFQATACLGNDLFLGFCEQQLYRVHVALQKNFLADVALGFVEQGIPERWRVECVEAVNVRLDHEIEAVANVAAGVSVN